MVEQIEQFFKYDNEESEYRGDRNICGCGQEHVLNAGLLKRTDLCVLPHTKSLAAVFPGTIMLSARVFPFFLM